MVYNMKPVPQAFLVRFGFFVIVLGGFFFWLEMGVFVVRFGVFLVNPFQTPGFVHRFQPTIFLWALELGMGTHESAKLCGPSSWGYSIPHFCVSPRVGDMYSHALVWPLDLGLWTPALRCGPPLELGLWTPHFGWVVVPSSGFILKS